MGSGMKVGVETVSPIKRTLSVEVTSDVVAKEFSTAYADLGRRVKVPGFRPGKVPLEILEKRYQREVEDDVIRRLVPRFYEEAVKEAGLSPVEFPTIDRVSIKKDAPLTFTATVEVRPPITLQPYHGLPISRRAVAVAESDVDGALAVLRERQAQLESFEDDHLLVAGDYAVIDFDGTVDGQPLPRGSAKGYLLQVGSGGVLPELDAALIGRRKGDRFDTPVRFPVDYRTPELAGRTASFQVTVIEAKRKVLPVLDDEFAKDLGVDTLGALRDRLRGELERRKREEGRVEERRALLATLLEQHTVELPPSLVKRETELIRDRILRHLAEEPSSQDLEALDRQAFHMAEERVKGDLILDAIAEREHLTVEQEELDREIERLAREARSHVEEVRRLVAGESGTFAGLRATLLREKTLDRLHSQAAVTEEEGPTSGLTSNTDVRADPPRGRQGVD